VVQAMLHNFWYLLARFTLIPLMTPWGRVLLLLALPLCGLFWGGLFWGGLFSASPFPCYVCCRQRIIYLHSWYERWWSALLQGRQGLGGCVVGAGVSLCVSLCSVCVRCGGGGGGVRSGTAACIVSDGEQCWWCWCTRHYYGAYDTGEAVVGCAKATIHNLQQ